MRRQISARVPEDTYSQLTGLAAVLHVSQADVITRALTALETTLTPDQQQALRLLRRDRS